MPPPAIDTPTGGEPSIPVTAEALVAAARLLLVPRPRLKRIALGLGVEVPELADLGAALGEEALAVLRRICGPVAVCLRRAIELDPDCAEAHALLAEVYEELGEAAAAADHRRKALALEPADEEEQTALARCLLIANRPEEAIDAFKASAAARSGAQFQVIRGGRFEDWAAEEGAGLVQLNPPAPLRCAFNVVFDGQLIPKTTEIHQRGLSVAEVGSLTLLRGFVPVGAHGNYIQGTIPDGREKELPGIRIRGRVNALVDEISVEQTIDEPCLVLCGYPVHYRNYFHAVAQSFVRLPLILREPEFAGMRIAVSERIRSWGKDILAAIGVSEDRLIYVKHDRSTMIRKAFLPSPPTRLGLPSAAEVRAFRDALFAGNAPPSANDRLFITRDAQARIQHRLLTNEPALQDMAMGHGHRVIDPGTMSIGQQIETFSQAAVICGSTGAGLTNLLYAPEDATILCFSPRETCRSYYLHLAAVTGLRFTWCLGSIQPESLASSLFPHLPFKVEEDNVRALFELLEAGRL